MVDPLDYMTHNQFHVLRSHKERQCTACALPIEPTEQVIIARSGVHHLTCYLLAQRYPISLSALSDRSKPIQEVVDKITNHNLQFQPALPTPSLLFFHIPYSPRVLLPCLLYLDSRSIIRASAVCRVWYNCASNSELWQCLITRDYPKASQSLLLLDKKTYFELQRERCYYCRENLGSEICPLMRKPLCLDCRLKEDFTLVTKRDVGLRLEVGTSWVERRRLAFIPAFGRLQVTYQWMVDAELKALRSALKRRVIDLFQLRRVKACVVEQVSAITDCKSVPEDPLLACAFDYIQRADDSRQSYAAMTRSVCALTTQSKPL